MSEPTPERDTSDAAQASDAVDVSSVSGARSANDASPVGDLQHEQARLAYSIIQTLLEHTRVTGDLVALMAQTLDEDTLKALTGTPHWAAYLDSRRALERARAEMEKFTELMTNLRGGEQG